MRNIIIPFLFCVITIILVFVMVDSIESFFTVQLQSLTYATYTYAIVSAMVLSADIILPVPSSIVMFLNGYVLGTCFGALLSIVSSLIGAFIGYCLGRFTSSQFKVKHQAQSVMLIAKYGSWAILLTRGIPILAESICMVCGYNRMSLKQYMLYNFMGYLPICLLYAACGSLGYDKDVFIYSFICSLLVSVLFWLTGKRFFTPPAQSSAEV